MTFAPPKMRETSSFVVRLVNIVGWLFISDNSSTERSMEDRKR